MFRKLLKKLPKKAKQVANSTTGFTQHPQGAGFTKHQQCAGFTLIELMVVIGILGILAAIVLASLVDARRNSSDSAVKEGLANARIEGGLYYEDSGLTYTGLCADSKIVDIRNAVATESADGSSYCYADDNEWVIAARLKTDQAFFWCVDHGGRAVSVDEILKDYSSVDPGDGERDCTPPF